jgi:membrane-bound lytic murein transglycosylase D
MSKTDKSRTAAWATMLAAATLSFIVVFQQMPPAAQAKLVAGGIKNLAVDSALIAQPAPNYFKDGPLVTAALDKAYTRSVKVQLQHFLTIKREDIKLALSESTRYIQHLIPILERYGLPVELVYLCIIESGYNNTARSYAGAVGMWQIIRATSSRFGIRTDSWVDERLDFEKSTEGAARFLKYLYERFGDWELVLAAYNAGEGRVSTAIKRAKKRGLDPVFKNLTLPRQTRIYVPAFYAGLLIAMEPERYGIFPDYRPQEDFFRVTVPGGVSILTLAREIGYSQESIYAMNPSILRKRVPPSRSGYSIRLPCILEPEKVNQALASLNEVNWIKYTVKKGDTLWEISRKFGVRAGNIDRVRSGGSPSKIFPGEHLMIPLLPKAGSKI